MPNQVESVKNGFAFATEQIVETTYAPRVETNDFAIQDRALHRQTSKGLCERLEAQKFLLAGNEFALTVLEVRNRTESIVLEFKDVIGMVERLFHQSEPHRVNAW
jgi:hypothetical protein